MATMTYEEIPELSPDELARWLSSNDPGKILRAVLSASLYWNDEAAALDICLAHMAHRNEDVARSSLTGIGHIARIHRNPSLDIKRIEDRIKELGLEKSLAGTVEDMRSDIQIFVMRGHRLQ